MTARELIAQLSQVGDLDCEIYLSKDAEGNAFKPLYDISIQTKNELDIVKSSAQVIVFWPS